MNAERLASNGRNRLLGALPLADLELLAPHLKELHLKQGALMQEAEEPIELVYFPQSGMVSLLTVMNDGAAIETATIGREGAVGGVVGLGGRRSASRAVSQVAGTSLQIASAQFKAALEQSAGIRALFERYQDAYLGLIHQSAGCNALHDVAQRLCRWLLQTRDCCDSEIIPLTQEFLGEMLGVQRSTVTLIARELQAEGLIRYRRGRIEITDHAAIERRSCECYMTIRRKSDAVFLRQS